MNEKLRRRKKELEKYICTLYNTSHVTSYDIHMTSCDYHMTSCDSHVTDLYRILPLSLAFMVLHGPLSKAL